jgi:hypothetical protein
MNVVPQHMDLKATAFYFVVVYVQQIVLICLQMNRLSPSYDLAPPPTPPPFPASKMSLFLSLPVSRRSSLLMVEGGGGGGGAKSYIGEKAWPSINHSILFDVYRTPIHKLINILNSAIAFCVWIHFYVNQLPENRYGFVQTVRIWTHTICVRNNI